MPQQVTITTIDGAILIRGVGGTALEIVSESPPPPPPPPPPDPEPVPTGFIWVDPAVLRTKPTTGAAWKTIEDTADASAGTPTLSNQDSKWSTNILATAYAWIATGKQAYRDKVMTALNQVVDGNLEKGARALGLARELPAIIIAADVMEIRKLDPALHAKLVAKFRYLLTFPTADGPASLVESMEERPNNWGTHAMFAALCAARYIGDDVLLQHIAAVFKGWLGDWESYHSFKYGDLVWQVNKDKPVGVLPVDAVMTIGGAARNLSGAMPEELRRGGGLKWPPTFTDYCWEALQGATGCMGAFELAGLSMKDVAQQAHLRAVKWLIEEVKWPPASDDGWQVPVINWLYDLDLPVTGGMVGKNLGYTNWTHQ